MQRQVHYFDGPGTQNTNACLDIVDQVVPPMKTVVVASTWGATGVSCARRFASRAKVVVVTHNVGFEEKNEDQMEPAARKQIEAAGGLIYTGTILTSSLEKSLMKQYQGIYPTALIAATFRRLGQGMKVCAEIVMEGCDAGMVTEGEDVVAVGGTGSGADTVCIINAACSHRFMELKIREILAKPRLF